MLWGLGVKRSRLGRGLIPTAIHMGFVVNKVTVGQVFLRALRFSPASYYSTIAAYSGRNYHELGLS